ncbi:MAG: hypothetical protein CMI02_14915 [Oceanospirillaceae bacterium]|nr:hypothetical protein [Oceanospirillaceae bacterium]
MGVAPTVYRWDDAGVPGRPGGNTGADRINYIAEVLRASLVNGYGAKTAAGWKELAFTPAVGSTSGELVLTNAGASGVAQLVLDASVFSFRNSRVGVGWESGALVGDVGDYLLSFRYTDDIQAMRWCVVANDASAVLLVWPPPDGLIGNDLSEDNALCLAIGSVMPWGSGIDPRAVPNFIVYAAYYVTANGAGSFNDSSGLLSLIEPDGSMNSGQVKADFTVRPGVFASSNDASFLDGAFELPVYPAIIDYQDVIFSRVPGWYAVMGLVADDALVELRDVDGLWTGSETTMNGRAVVLVANRYNFGYISLEPEDWP